jgi:hypothetical protein
MKVLFCQECGDIIAPYRQNKRPRFCDCGRHAVWWRDGNAGLISAHDTLFVPPANTDPYATPRVPKAWILGMTNSFLNFPNFDMSAEDIQAIIDSHPDTYMFKTRRTCIVRFRPGHSSDSRWESKLPEPDQK